MSKRVTAHHVRREGEPGDWEVTDVSPENATLVRAETEDDTFVVELELPARSTEVEYAVRPAQGGARRRKRRTVLDVSGSEDVEVWLGGRPDERQGDAQTPASSSDDPRQDHRPGGPPLTEVVEELLERVEDLEEAVGELGARADAADQTVADLSGRVGAVELVPGQVQELATSTAQGFTAVDGRFGTVEARLTVVEDTLSKMPPVPDPDPGQPGEPGQLGQAVAQAVSLTTSLRDGVQSARTVFAQDLGGVSGGGQSGSARSASTQLSLLEATAQRNIVLYQAVASGPGGDSEARLRTFERQVRQAGSFYATTVDRIAELAVRAGDVDERRAFTRLLASLRGGSAAAAVAGLRDFVAGDEDQAAISRQSPPSQTGSQAGSQGGRIQSSPTTVGNARSLGAAARVTARSATRRGSATRPSRVQGGAARTGAQP